MELRILIALFLAYGYDCSAGQGFTMSFGPPQPIRGISGYGGKLSNVLDLYPDGFASPIYHGIVQSANGGKSFLFVNSTRTGIFQGFVHHKDADGHSWAHDFGAAMLVTANSTATSLSSNFTNSYRFVNGAFTIQERAGPGVSFVGLPIPLCPAPKNFLTFYAGGHVTLSDGTHLLTGELRWCTSRMFRGRGTLVAFHSQDGYNFEYVGNVSTPANIPQSSEGPNEHALALLPNGDVLCIMRTGAGDGRGGYLPFYKSLSHDGGKTWSDPQGMPGMGCARPQLLQLGNATLLSAGRKMINPEYDRGFDVWLSMDNGVTWEHRSGSYEHNAGRNVTGASFWPEHVNKTGGRWDFTSGYTGLVRVGESSAMVLYDTLWMPPHIEQHVLEESAGTPRHSFTSDHITHNQDLSFGLEHPDHNPPYSFGMRIDVVPITRSKEMII